MAEGGLGNIVTDLKTELECSICCGQITHAKLLKCLHTFCEICLVKLDKQGTILCPICRTTTDLPEQGVHGLSPNFFFNRIIDIVKTQGGSEVSGVSVCSNCESGKLVKFYCFDCKHFLCEPCTDTHNKMKLLTSGHHVVELNGFSSADYRAFVGRSGNCEKHDKEELKFFCEDCNKCICITCTVIDHHNHKCLYLDEAVALQKDNLKQMMKKVQENNSRLDTRRERLNQSSLAVQRNAEQAKDSLKASTDQLMQMIRNHVEKATSDINKEVNNNLHSISKLQKDISTKQSKIKDCLKFAEDLLGRGCLPEIMELKGVLSERLKELDSHQVTDQPSTRSRIRYKVKDGVIDALQVIGRVQTSFTDPSRCTVEGDGKTTATVGQEACFTVTTRNENGDVTHSEDDCVIVEIKSVARDLMIPVNITQNGSGRYTVSFAPVFPGKCNVHIDINNENITGKLSELTVNPEAEKIKKKPRKRTPKPGTKHQESSAYSPTADDKSDDNCVICMDEPKNPVSLNKCGHTFCKGCIDQAFSHRKTCPICGIVYGVLTGNQPQGTMNCHYDKCQSLPGYERRAGSIRIDYFFPDGTQGPEHPNPGQRYYGTSRTAYLPDCPEGREVLQLLKKAFDARLTFTIGTSVTTGMGNVVTWNGIHHKTNIYGGSSGYGYPDPTYLTRVKEELASKGIV